MNGNNDFKYRETRTGKEEIRIEDIFHAIIKKWWLILIITLVMGLIALLYTRITYVPLYVANASMVINTDKSYDVNMVNTYGPILVSDNVLEKVATESQRSIDPEIMRKSIEITSPNGSGVINVAVTESDPQTAMDIANAMIRVAPTVIAETFTTGTFKALDSAKYPKAPDPPKYLMNIAIGMIFGFILGVLIVVGLRVLYPKIRSEKEINQNLLLNVIGEIPINPDSDGKIKKQLITDPGVGVLYVEAFKRLGIHVQNIAAKQNYKKFLLTSALEDDGKTTVSFNLSLVLASTGASVLFIEGDVHKSDISRAFNNGLSIGQTFANLRKGEKAPKECIAKYPGLELYVLPLKPENIGNGYSFNENEIGQVMSLLENEFDYMIIDSPPTLILSDAAILSKYVDGVIIVIKQEQSGLDVLIKAINNLEVLGANMVGSILTDDKNSKINFKNLRKSMYPKNPKNRKFLWFGRKKPE